jgi:hypothetical protein
MILHTRAFGFVPFFLSTFLERGKHDTYDAMTLVFDFPFFIIMGCISIHVSPSFIFSPGHI